MGRRDPVTARRAAAQAAIRALLACALGTAPRASHATDNPATETEGHTVEVVGITPVPGLGMPLRDIPSAVQSVGDDALRRAQALDATEHMDRRFAGVSTNAAQANPFQPDLQFRGFTASHLLGTPQGVSVFVDGVRVNEAFGDVVNWDLIQRNAIATAHLLSGANPVFGLNTLGGALSVNTKSGFTFPGQSFRLQAGAFERRAMEFESGGHGEQADYFIAADRTEERGWRDHSPSALGQLFAKAGWEDARGDIDLSLALAENTLQGTQALPRSWLATAREAYTWPDRTRNELQFATLRASRYLADGTLLAGVAHYRRLVQSNTSSNVNEDFDALQPAGNGNAPAFNDRYALRQQMSGLTLQLTQDDRLFGRRNRLTIGFNYDRSAAEFAQDRQEALFSADRGTEAISDFVATTRVRANNTYRGLYFSNHLSATPSWTLALFGRYNSVDVRLADASGLQPALNAAHAFRRFSPGIGANYNPHPRVTWFASVGQGMRVPSPMELSCADPAAPCTLPNQFLADPALKPVVARTFEAGLRAKPLERVAVSAVTYRSVLRDDIQFVGSGGALNAGFFQNVGRTLRQGLEVTASASFGEVRLEAAYGAVRATYLSAFLMHSPNNSTRDASGDIAVSPGDRIPGIARQQFKLNADWMVGRGTLALGWAWFDRQFARGDENNRDANGPLPGYGVAFASARFSPAPGWELALKIDNLFDRRYENFGILGQNFFNGPDRSFDPAAAAAEQFRSPGAPRALWLSVRYEMAQAGRR